MAEFHLVTSVLGSMFASLSQSYGLLIHENEMEPLLNERFTPKLSKNVFLCWVLWVTPVLVWPWHVYACCKTSEVWKQQAQLDPNSELPSCTNLAYYYQHCNVRSREKTDYTEWRHAWLSQFATLGLVVVMHGSVTCDTVLVTYWSQVCWERARGRGRGSWRRRSVAISVTQGAFPLADEGLLVPLHPLQLLISTHLAPLLLLCRVPRVQTLQGTFWSLLRGVGGKGVDTNEQGRKWKYTLGECKSIANVNREWKRSISQFSFHNWDISEVIIGAYRENQLLSVHYTTMFIFQTQNMTRTTLSELSLHWYRFDFFWLREDFLLSYWFFVILEPHLHANSWCCSSEGHVWGDARRLI